MLALFLNKISAFKYHVQDGACPVKVGELNSNMKANLDRFEMAGNWINVYDRKDMNDHVSCYGV